MKTKSLMTICLVVGLITILNGTALADGNEVSDSGWMTSLNCLTYDVNWLDDGESWYELRDPLTGEPFDFNSLDFMVIPEPATVVLLGLGGLFLCRRKHPLILKKEI